MISVNQGIGTSVPKTWGRGEGGNMFLIKEGEGLFSCEGWRYGGHHGGHCDFKTMKTKYNSLGQSFISKVKHC